jgi:hypothetical protein
MIDLETDIWKVAKPLVANDSDWFDWHTLDKDMFDVWYMPMSNINTTRFMWFH